jgi:hypothetical protein
MASGLPQMLRVTAEDKVGWYMHYPSVVGNNDDVLRCADSEYSRGRAVVTAVDKK